MAVDVHSEPAPEAPARRMSYEEFLQTDDEGWAEWVNGEVIPMSSPSTEHHLIAMWLSKVLDEYAGMRKLGVVIPAPFQMKTAPDLPGREPDILFVAAENRERLKKNHLEGPADLVVEIVSPESGGRDRGDKFYEYERGGVREYWLLDPQRRQAECYRRGDDGLLHAAPLSDGASESAVLPGLRLREAWLWEDPRPTLLEMLREWGLLA